jgi:repressor LexA
VLTQLQKQALDFIVSYQAESGGVSPTFQEIIEHVGCASKSAAHRLTAALEERGFIRRMKNHARAIEVLRLSNGEYVRTTRPGVNSGTPTKRDVILPVVGKPPRIIAQLCPAGRVR